METWHRLGVVGLKIAFAHGELNPVAYASYLLDHIDRVNPGLNALAQLDRPGIEQAAHASAGRYRLDTQRVLDGIPLVISSDIMARGLDQTAGLVARRGMIANRDAMMVEALRSAGAVIIGSAGMDEAGLDCGGDSGIGGRIYNPHGDGLSPGGAAGGCASALATGMAVGALGNDALGAVRLSAAGSSLFALRPSRGAASTDGFARLNASFDAPGFAARSMDDLSAMATAAFAPDISTAMQSFEFLVLEDAGGLPLHDDMGSFYHYALSLLPDQPREISLPTRLDDLAIAATAFAEWTLAGFLSELGEERCSSLSPAINRRILKAMSLSRDGLIGIVEMLKVAGQAMRGLVTRDTILLTPAAAHPALPHGVPVDPARGAFAVLADVSGLPAVVMPAGVTRDKRPLALQLIGPMGSEALLMAQARMLSERMRGNAAPAIGW